MDLVRLAISFGKVGIFGFGGGPSMIPLIQEEVVDAQRWLSKEEFLDAFAFGNTLPGPIATKIAGYVGFKVAGWLGATISLAAITLPTILAMIALATLYLKYRESPLISGFLEGVRPVVIALLLLVVYQFIPSAFGLPKAWLGNWHLWLIAEPKAWLGNWHLWLIAAVAFVLAIRYGIHPAVLIAVGGLVGIAFLS